MGQTTKPDVASSSDAKKSGEVILTPEQFETLMNRLNKLENTDTTKTQTATPADTGFDQAGKPIGIIQKFSVDPADYIDPRPMLYDLPELVRFAFKQNYVLDWEVDQLLYDTKYGSAVSEPKFTLTLKQKRFDENGDVRPGLILRGRGIFFEDPMASIKEAVAMGLPLDDSNSREFLSQMRFLRYQAWLVDILSPRRPDSAKRSQHEEVINGRAYIIEEYSTAT
jgi:hypothetical protein